MSRARVLADRANQNTLAVETDSSEVGISSASPRSTLDVRGEVQVGTTIQAGVAGVVTATSFSGSGANLTGLATTETVRTDTLTVAGVSTLTGAVNVDATTDSTSSSTGALIVDGGLGVAKNVYIGAGLSVAGTLTYEDVTSVVSVGLITAKSGVNITGGELTVGSGITMGIAGVATFSGTADVHLHDNVKLLAGDSSDLSVYHSGSQGIINNSTGNLSLQSSGNIWIENQAGSKVYIKTIADQQVEAYYNNSKKWETTNDGTVTTGISTATGGLAINADSKNLTIGASEDLKLYHDGSDSYIRNTTNTDLRIQNIGNAGIDIYNQNSYPIRFTTNGSERARLTSGGRVGLGTISPAEELHIFRETAVVALVDAHGANDSRVRNKAPSDRISN